LIEVVEKPATPQQFGVPGVYMFNSRCLRRSKAKTLSSHLLEGDGDSRLQLYVKSTAKLQQSSGIDQANFGAPEIIAVT
jgi:hypothetical protein